MLSAPKLDIAKEDGRGAFGHVTTNCNHLNEHLERSGTHAGGAGGGAFTYSHGILLNRLGATAHRTATAPCRSSSNSNADDRNSE